VSKKIVAFVCLAVAVALVAGCAGKINIPSPVKKIAPAGPISAITIKAEPTGKIAVGQSVILTATAQDANGRKVSGNEFTWKSDAEGRLSATAGKSVTFTLLTKPGVACYVSAESNGIEGMIAIEGK